MTRKSKSFILFLLLITSGLDLRVTAATRYKTDTTAVFIAFELPASTASHSSVKAGNNTAEAAAYRKKKRKRRTRFFTRKRPRHKRKRFKTQECPKF